MLLTQSTTVSEEYGRLVEEKCMHAERYAEALKALCRDHHGRRISVTEYRGRRRQIIDQLDHEYNGGRSSSQGVEITQRVNR